MVDEDLSLVFKPAEGGAVHNAVAIALELVATLRQRFGMYATAAARRIGRVGGEPLAGGGDEIVHGR